MNPRDNIEQYNSKIFPPIWMVSFIAVTTAFFVGFGVHFLQKTFIEAGNAYDTKNLITQLQQNGTKTSLDVIISQLVGGIAEWKIYRNEKFGYKIEYPNGWEVIEAKPRIRNEATWEGNILIDEEIQKVTFLERKYVNWQGEFQIRILANPDKLNLEQWIRYHEPRDVTGGSLIQGISDTIVDGRVVKKLSIFGFDHEGIAIVLLYKGNICDISFAGSNPNDAEVKKHQEIYQQMLSTFRFID